MKNFITFLTEMPYLARGVKKPTKAADFTDEDHDEIKHDKEYHLLRVKKKASKKIGEMNGYHIFKDKKPGRLGSSDLQSTDYKLVHPKTNEVHMSISGAEDKKKNFSVEFLSAHHPDRKVKAHDFYHHLLMNKHVNSIESDSGQSRGGRKTWARLAHHHKKDISVKKGDERVTFTGKRTFSRNYMKPDFSTFIARRRND